MKKPTFHKKCRTISVYSFFMASLQKDARYLIKRYDEDEDANKYLKYKDDKDLQLILSEMLFEYSILIADKKTMKIRKLEYQVKFLNGKYNVIVKILNTYKDTGVVEVLDILNDLDVPFNSEKKIEPQIDKAIRSTKIIKNKINIANARLKKLLKINVGEEAKEQNPNDFMINLDKTALLLETNLELGYRINIKKTSVERWVNFIKLNEKKVIASNA